MSTALAQPRAASTSDPRGRPAETINPLVVEVLAGCDILT